MQESNHLTREVKARSIKSTLAWCWQDKAALRKIRDAFDQSNDVASAIGVYVAMTEIASDSGSERFQTTHAWIQRVCGWSIRTIQARLKTLAEIGLIHIETSTSLRQPNTYTLQSDPQPLPNDTQPLPNVRQLAKQGSLPTSEENKKKLSEEIERNVGANKSRPASEESEWIGSLKADSAYQGIDVSKEHAKMIRWCEANRKQPTRRRFVNWLNRVDTPINTQGRKPESNQRHEDIRIPDL